MKFAYLPLAVRQASPALRGARVRHRPIVPIHILGPRTLPPMDACIDCASDDTVFPPHFATRLGVDSATAPKGQLRLVGRSTVTINDASVSLSDGYESCTWDAVVGFSTVPMRWALFGHTGFLEFFDVQLLGARHEAVEPNAAFAGQRIVHAKPTP